jgi:thiol-disulfide isomerase/thioredoxin
VDADLRIASGVAPGAEAIQRLVAANTTAPALEVVHRGPASIRLPDLDGDSVDLEDFRGSETLVLFWNPGCGFCRQMLDDLRDWEGTRPDGAPELLVVSRGGVDDNRALGLESLSVLDEGTRVMQTFGAPGTPAAVLVDEDGAVASSVAVGAQEVLALARDGHRRTTGVAS